MNYTWLITVTLSLLWCLIRNCGGEGLDDLTKMMGGSTANSTNKKYCGTYLAETLSTMCKGVYPTFRPARIHKKSYWPSQFHEDQFPFQSKQQATSMLGKFVGRRKRRRRGVYNECCQKPCNIEQLMLYCGTPSTTRSPPTP